jgi:hypothetical protein
VPILFLFSSLILVANTLVEKPVESLFGVLILALGVPAYIFWQKQKRRT